jgi:hypothetical protein
MSCRHALPVVTVEKPLSDSLFTTSTPLSTLKILPPEGAELAIMVPMGFDIWVFTQKERALFAMSGVGVAIGPDDTYVHDAPIEFSIGDRQYFSGFKAWQRLPDSLVAILRDDNGVPPIVLTNPMQLLDFRPNLEVPANFDGWGIFLRRLPTESTLCSEVKVVEVRRIEPISGGNDK